MRRRCKGEGGFCRRGVRSAVTLATSGFPDWALPLHFAEYACATCGRASGRIPRASESSNEDASLAEGMGAQRPIWGFFVRRWRRYDYRKCVSARGKRRLIVFLLPSLDCVEMRARRGMRTGNRVNFQRRRSQPASSGPSEARPQIARE